MTTMADLVRRECECGVIFFQATHEPKATECNDCFRMNRTKMTTEGTEEKNVTIPPPLDAKEQNGAHEAPKRERKAKATAELAAVLDATDVLDAIEQQIALLDSEEKRALERLNRIRELRGRLGLRGLPARDIEPSSARPRPAKPRKPTAGASTRHRRSAEELAKGVDAVVALVAKHKGGLRAEQIREHLGLEAKHMPMLLKAALEGKWLRRKGQKRATTYSLR